MVVFSTLILPSGCKKLKGHCVLILKHFQSEVFLRSASPQCYPGNAASLILPLFVECEGFSLSACWRCSLGQSWNFASCRRWECVSRWQEVAGASVSLRGGWAGLTQHRRRKSRRKLPCGLPLLPGHANLSAGQCGPVWFKGLFQTGFWIYLGKLPQNLQSLLGFFVQ